MEVGLDMRRTMIMALVIILMAAVGVAWAGEDTHHQAAAELLDLAHMDELLSQTIDQMLALQIQQNPQLAPYEQVMKEFFNKYMGWDALKEDFIKIYEDEFTEAELKDMIVFYKTPTGQKAIMKTPVLAAKGAELGQKRVQENVGELIQMIKEAQEKMQPEEEQNEETQQDEGTQDNAQ